MNIDRKVTSGIQGNSAPLQSSKSSSQNTATYMTQEIASLHFGALRKEHAEMILARYPTGSWLLRYSVREGQVVVSRKSEAGYENIINLKFNEVEYKIDKIPVNFLLNYFKAEKLIMPKPKESTKIDLNHFSPNSYLVKECMNEHPASFTSLSSDDAYSILQSYPTGTWLIRFDDKKALWIVTRKTEKGMEDVETIVLNNNEKNIKDASVENLFNYFDKSKLLFPLKEAYSQKIAKDKCFIIPNMPFKPTYRLKFDGTKSYEEFKIKWNNSKIDPNFKIHFDEVTKSVYIPYSGDEILAFSHKYEFLQDYFGSHERNFFNGYVKYDNGITISAISDQKKLKFLLEESRKFFKGFISKPVNLNIPIVNNFSELLADNFIKLKNQGLLVGEIHGQYQPKEMLIKNMRNFKEAGVEVLFMEHLLYDSIQSDLDEYNQSNKMSSMLESYLDSLDRNFLKKENHPFGYKALVKAAYKEGIRIVALDTQASYKAGYDERYGSKGPERIMGMNYQAAQIILKEGEKKKYIALVGDAHVSTCYQVPGLSEILQVPNAVILSSNEQQPTVQANVTNLLPQLDIHESKPNEYGGNVNYLFRIPKQNN